MSDRSCDSCGHFESHAPRTANLSSGRCPVCMCLSGWQKPEHALPLFASNQRAADEVFGFEPLPEADLFEVLKGAVRARETP